MKNIVFILLFLFPLSMWSQAVKDVEYIGSGNEGYFPVLKEGKWGFMDSLGKLTVDFRTDLIHNKKKAAGRDVGVASMSYPVLSQGRAITRKDLNGIPYYGYINEKGEEIVKPQYLNLSNFKDDYAFGLKIEERYLGRNDLLDIKIKSYKYDVVLLDRNGEIKQYLAGPFPIGLAKEKLRQAPPINVRMLKSNLVAVKNPAGKWEVHRLDGKI